MYTASGPWRTLKPLPGRIGLVSIDLAIQAGDMGALDAKEVAVTLSNRAAGIEPIRRSAIRINEAEWRVDDLTLPAAGTWTAKIDILVSDFDQITPEGRFLVGK